MRKDKRKYFQKTTYLYSSFPLLLLHKLSNILKEMKRFFFIVFIQWNIFYLNETYSVCRSTKIGLYNETKFPNSSFTHYKAYTGHAAQKLRLIPGLHKSWHTLSYSEGWVQIDLGKIYAIYALDVRGSCHCPANKPPSYYYTKTFKMLYSLEGSSMETYAENGQEKVN